MLKEVRRVILKRVDDGREMNLPVPLQNFQIGHGCKVETVNINGLGDMNLPGNPTLATIYLELEFPSQKRPYVCIDDLPNPYAYPNTFQKFIDEHTLLRFLIAGTTVNMLVLLEKIEFGEQDGTGDIYATLTLREYRQISAPKAGEEVSAVHRDAPEQSAKEQSYTVQKGDVLCTVSKRFYGDASLAYKLASFNQIKNPNVIQTGQVLKIPERSRL